MTPRKEALLAALDLIARVHEAGGEERAQVTALRNQLARERDKNERLARELFDLRIDTAEEIARLRHQLRFAGRAEPPPPPPPLPLPPRPGPRRRRQAISPAALAIMQREPLDPAAYDRTIQPEEELKQYPDHTPKP